MSNLTLLIGNKNYSSWSLRGWLAMKRSGLNFTEELIPLDMPDTHERMGKRSPAKLVPVLIEDGVSIWDTLSIIERVNELAPEAGIWPTDPIARAVARSVSAEMHTGFSQLRTLCPMNLRRVPAPIENPEQIAADVARFDEIVRSCRDRFANGNGAFLFGSFSAADIMYAPLATRIRTYAIEVASNTAAYVEAIHADANMCDWIEAGVAEKWTIDHDEV